MSLSTSTHMQCVKCYTAPFALNLHVRLVLFSLKQGHEDQFEISAVKQRVLPNVYSKFWKMGSDDANQPLYTAATILCSHNTATFFHASNHPTLSSKNQRHHSTLISAYEIINLSQVQDRSYQICKA